MHAFDEYTDFYIPAYILNDETINKLTELHYTTTKANETDDEKFPYDAYNICWSDDSIF